MRAAPSVWESGDTPRPVFAQHSRQSANRLTFMGEYRKYLDTQEGEDAKHLHP